jgi:hypothetical protein
LSHFDFVDTAAMATGSPTDERSEEGRALPQARVALFWTVMFFISLLSASVGALGVVAKPGRIELVVTLGQTAQTGLFWWLCARGQRSPRFSRRMEMGGLLINLSAGALLGRFVTIDFARDHSIVTADGILMVDGYITMLHVAGYSLWLAVRAAAGDGSRDRILENVYSRTQLPQEPRYAYDLWARPLLGGSRDRLAHPGWKVSARCLKVDVRRRASPRGLGRKRVSKTIPARLRE